MCYISLKIVVVYVALALLFIMYYVTWISIIVAEFYISEFFFVLFFLWKQNESGPVIQLFL